VTLRILSLAETDLLDGFRFYERQGRGVGWYFLESLNSDIESLRLYAGAHRRVFGYQHVTFERMKPDRRKRIEAGSTIAEMSAAR
jgi:hypothetical protein